MKKYIVFLILLLFITGCGKEEAPKGDILDFETDVAMTNYYEYDSFKYNMVIRSSYQGKPYNNTIFSFMVDNELGMYLFNYHQITKDITNKDLYNKSIIVNKKEYNYYIENDTMNIIYNIDNEYYLQLSIKSLNNDLGNTNDLFNYFDFNINVK